MRTKWVTILLSIVAVGTFLPFLTASSDVFGYYRSTRSLTYWSLLPDVARFAAPLSIILSAACAFAALTHRFWKTTEIKKWRRLSSLCVGGLLATGRVIWVHILFVPKTGLFWRVEIGPAVWVMFLGYLFATLAAWKIRPWRNPTGGGAEVAV